MMDQRGDADQRHLHAVPDLETDAAQDWPNGPDERVTAAALEDQAALDALNAVLADANIPKLSEAHQLETIQRIRAERRAKPLPGPFADVHTKGYRRGGRRRKRELAVYRETNEPGLQTMRTLTRAQRRAVRAQG